ncbi:hypothetical protein L6164_036691 [Bauhinia variegata]|uniref:Uncharacterized protein n=1 Tax=Bauhinia variegata TaxID=167791 RepID=A0ACB9KI13_BAUVA|nr:hypothetical protein L6164_036691 [Bauhinia variegata]
MEKTESDTGNVSSAQAVLLGALAPGVNFRFHMDCIKVEFFTAGSVRRCYAGLSILSKRLIIDASCCIPCSNLCFPLLTA